MTTTGARPRIALVTCDAHPLLYADEQLLPARFAAAGIDATPQSWSDPAVAWSEFDRVVLRSMWDYFERIDEFTVWIDRLAERRIPVCNPASLVRWNLDKRYLADLAARGVRIVPTHFVAPGDRLDLGVLVRGAGWPEAILKPAVSGGAYRTHRFTAANAPSLQGELDAILRKCGALVQPFLPEIAAEGEWSLLFFGGAFSHAVIKTPAPGDFRVQSQFGGDYRAAEPPPSLLAAATAIVAALPSPAVYARIDGVRRDDAFLLMEVEAIEPYLFLPHSPNAIDRYVAAVAAL